MLYILPQLPLQIILSYLDFQDIISLTKVPIVRKVIFDYYKSEFNQKELIRSTIIALIINLVDEFYSFKHVFGDILNNIGMVPFRYTNKYHKIHSDILNQKKKI